MATIRKRGDYQWQAIVKRKGFPVQRRTFTYRKDAETWARDTEAAMERGLWMDRTEAERTTVAEALDRYLSELASKPDHSIRVAKSCAANLRRHPISRISLAALRSADVARYRDDRLRHVKPATVVRDLAVLSHVFTVAIKDWGMGYLSNPVMAARKPKIGNNRRDRRLVGNEEERLLAACREYGGVLHDVVVFALETAMRRGEIARMEWAHVNLGRRIVHLPETKNGEPRNVPLSSRAVAVLEARGKVRKIDDGRVFPIHPDAITTAFSRACRRAGIEDLRFHDLRHEATSRLFEKGLNPMQVAAVTGHKTLQMLKRYTHLRAEDLAQLLG